MDSFDWGDGARGDSRTIRAVKRAPFSQEHHEIPMFGDTRTTRMTARSALAILTLLCVVCAPGTTRALSPPHVDFVPTLTAPADDALTLRFDDFVVGDSGRFVSADPQPPGSALVTATSATLSVSLAAETTGIVRLPLVFDQTSLTLLLRPATDSDSVRATTVTAPRLVRHATRLPAEARDAGLPVGARSTVFQFIFKRGSSGAPLDPASVLVMIGNEVFRPGRAGIPGPGPVVPEGHDLIVIAIPPQPPGRHPVRVNAADTSGVLAREAFFHLVEGTAGREAVDWRREVIYLLETDRFHNGSRGNDQPLTTPLATPLANFAGGDWKGIQRRIEEGYFTRLGVTVLCVSPLTRNPDGAWSDDGTSDGLSAAWHGRWAADAREPNPRFGTAADLRDMVRAAHRRGIRVLAGLAPGHVHESHPHHRDNPGWFHPATLPDGRPNVRLFAEHPDTTRLAEFLPTFDHAGQPAAVRAVVRDSVTLAMEAQLDGFLHHAADLTAPSLWSQLSRAVKTDIVLPTGRPFLQLGMPHGAGPSLAPQVGPGGLDGFIDTATQRDIRRVMAEQTEGFALLDSTLRTSPITAQPWAVNPISLGDPASPRFMAPADGWRIPDDGLPGTEITVRDRASMARLRNAFTLMLTMPATPLIHYGDETGMTGGAEPDNSRVMRFGRQLARHENELLGHVGRLTTLRQAHPALRDGDVTPLLVEDDTYVYLRSTFDKRMVVAIHRGTRDRSVELRLPAWCPDRRTPQKLIGNHAATIEGDLMRFRISGASASIFHLR